MGISMMGTVCWDAAGRRTRAYSALPARAHHPPQALSSPPGSTFPPTAVGCGWQAPGSPLPPRQEQSYEHPAGETFIPAESLTLLINPCAHSVPLPRSSEAHRTGQKARFEPDTFAYAGVRVTRGEGVGLALRLPAPHSHPSSLPAHPGYAYPGCCFPPFLSGLIVLNFTPSLTNCPPSLISASESIFYSLPFFFLIARSLLFFLFF